METKHTQGPREMFNNHEGIIGVVGIPADVAYCCAPGLVLDQRRTDEEHEANARLMAAAPELLAELESLLEDFNHACHKLGLPYDTPPAKKARAAIAKATGG